MKLSAFLFCFLFFTWKLLSQEPGQSESKIEAKSSQTKQECEQDIHSLKDQFEKFREDLQNAKKDQDIIKQQHLSMDEAIKKMENVIQKFENTFKTQSQKLEENANLIRQLKEDTMKQLYKVDEKYASLKEEIVKSEHIPNKIMSIDNKYNKELISLKNQTATLQKKINQIEATSFKNIASEAYSNLLESALAFADVVANYFNSIDWSWIQDRVVWKHFNEFCMESFENSKRYVYGQLIPAFKTQAIYQYTHFKQLFEKLYYDLHHHKYFNLALEKCKPYLDTANIPPIYHEYVLDGIVVVALLIELFIIYGVFLFICGLFCPVIPKPARNQNDDDQNDSNSRTKKENKNSNDNNVNGNDNDANNNTKKNQDTKNQSNDNNPPSKPKKK